MVDVPVLLLEIDKLDAGARGEEEIVGGLGDIATMVEPIGLYRGRKFDLHLAGGQVPAREKTRVAAGGSRRGPDLAIDDQQILGRLVAAAGVRSLPQQLPRGRIEGAHLAIAGGEDDDPLVNDQLGAEVEAAVLAPAGGLRPPALLACFPVKTDNLSPIVKIDPALVRGESQWSDARATLPQLLTRTRLVTNDATRLLVPDELGEDTSLVPDIELRNVTGQLGQLIIGKSKNQPIGDDDLLGGAGFLIDTQGFPGDCIDLLQRRNQTPGHVDPVPYCHQPPGKLGRTALERPEVVMPFSNRAFPENHPIEGVPGDELPA